MHSELKPVEALLNYWSTSIYARLHEFLVHKLTNMYQKWESACPYAIWLKDW
jgi:hypothetical protein